VTQQSIGFDRAAEYYDATRGFPPGVEVGAGETIAKAGGFTHQSRVLEVGVGTGRIALPVAPHVGKYVGIDLSRLMVERLLSKSTTERVTVAIADATRLPFNDNTFDGAVAVHVFHLIPNWRDALRELARVLRPEAPLIHCYDIGSREHEEVRALQAVWDKAVPQDRTRRPGIDWKDYDTFLPNEGWQHRNTEAYTFINNSFSPALLLESWEKRLGSGTWMMNDEDHRRGVEAVRTYINAHYPDPTQHWDIQSKFQAMAYLPPTSR
jgi:ubiquinone/menaquinone biosynthesis C-methylase UbiE